MKDKPSGGVRLASLIDSGIPFRGGIWIDTYNQMYNISMSMVIKARINGNNCYYVTQAYET